MIESIGAASLGFDFRPNQIEYSVSSGSPPLQRFFETGLRRR